MSASLYIFQMTEQGVKTKIATFLQRGHISLVAVKPLTGSPVKSRLAKLLHYAADHKPKSLIPDALHTVDAINPALPIIRNRPEFP